MVTVDGEAHFVGNVVSKRLAYANPASAIEVHCKGIAIRYPIITAGGCRVFAGSFSPTGLPWSGAVRSRPPNGSSIGCSRRSCPQS
jgi:hypothetical protein